MTKTLEMLGYKPDDRVLIIHADDVGFSHASNVAAFEAMDAGQPHLLLDARAGALVHGDGEAPAGAPATPTSAST